MWISITTADIQTRLAGAEVEALRTAALADDQADPLPEIVSQVVDEVRGYVAAGGYTLGDGETVPSKLFSATLAMVRFRCATRLPGYQMDENRRREYEDAIRLMERVADGRYAVEEPAAASSEVIGGQSPSVTGKTLSMDRTSQNGI